MASQNNDSLLETKYVDDDKFTGKRYVDIHCHCLPGVDDGPATMSEALDLCQALVDEGVTAVVATPHQLGRFSGCNEAAQIREAVLILDEKLKNNGIVLRVVPGADVRVDERICQLLEDDKVLTLADGGKYILLELPHDVFIDIEPLLVGLDSMNVRAILSHPERHANVARKPNILMKWLERSAHLQLTAGSLLGDFGPVVQKFAWQLLDAGLISLVATDCHNLDGRRPRMAAAFKLISDKLGQTIANLVCIENPLRVLKGQDMTVSLSTRMRGNGEKRSSF